MGKIGQEVLPTLPMLCGIRIAIVRAEREPGLLDGTVPVLLKPLCYGEIAHRLLHALGERTGASGIGPGERCANAAVVEGEDIPVAPVPSLPYRSTKVAGSRVLKEETG